jgi:RHS repeat-associated protein
MRASVRAPYADQSDLDDPSVRKTTYVYDASGNQDVMTNPTLGSPATAGTVSDVDYDPLNRLIKSLQDVGGISAKTEYGYDALSRLIKVKDPKSLDTVYSYDGLGDQTSLNSPDTGITAFTYDGAGNRKTVLDARGVKSELTYDALNRLTKIEYTAAGATAISSAKTVQFFYDQADAITACNGAFSAGRLTGFSDETGSTTLCYDRRGNVITKKQTANGSTMTLSMGINRADRLTGVVYPSGMSANYTRDIQGRITGMSINGVAFITAVSYLPFGPVHQITFANGKTLTKTYDQNYDIDAITSTAVGGLNLDYSVDEVGNIVGVNQSGIPFKLNYDKLYRLDGVRDQNNMFIEEFTYDATGNRLSKRLGNAPTLPYTYATSSHKLTNAGDGVRSLDANGNTLNTPQNVILSYDERNRLVNTTSSCPKPCFQPYNTSAMYNARGERVIRSISSFGPLQTKVMMFDEAGKLLVDDGGEIVYLDQTPIARVNAGVIYPIETDHLGSPRVLLDTSGSSAVWTWNLLTNSTTGSNAFGEQAPSSSVLEFNLRFPGQYADGNGISYNYFRDYEPGTGRYLESDPIGLNGGISTYGYALSFPLRLTDSNGLAPYCRPFESWEQAYWMRTHTVPLTETCIPPAPCKTCIHCDNNYSACKSSATSIGAVTVTLTTVSAISFGVAFVPSPATPALAACGAATRTGAAIFGAAYFAVNYSCESAYSDCKKTCLDSQICEPNQLP